MVSSARIVIRRCTPFAFDLNLDIFKLVVSTRNPSPFVRVRTHTAGGTMDQAPNSRILISIRRPESGSVAQCGRSGQRPPVEMLSSSDRTSGIKVSTYGCLCPPYRSRVNTVPLPYVASGGELCPPEIDGGYDSVAYRATWPVLDA